MKIKVNAQNHRFSLWFPLSAIKWRFIWKNIDQENKEIDYRKMTSKVYKELKKWKKENGSFTLVDVESKDAIVKITI